VVADERTNSVVISGEPKARARIIQMVRQLDRDLQSQGNTRVFYLKYGKAKDLVDVLKGVSSSIAADKKGGAAATATGGASIGGGQLAISADETTNALVITAQPDVMAELEQVIAKLDIRRAQVLVEAIIVEISDGDGMNLGVQWANTNGGGTQFTDTGLPIGSLAIAAKDYKDNGNTDGLSSLAGSFSGMAAGFYHGDWAALVTALSTNSKNDILSTPSIVTMDNKEASFNVGQEVPVQSGSQSSTTSDQVFNTIERKTVGTKLVVTPQINEGDSVLLNIEQEVSSVAQKQATGTANLGPTFDTRTVKNAVLVKSGETVVLGGLMDEQTQEQISKVPLLGDIPVLGYLFRSSKTSTAKRNLMVFIRPTILRDANVYSGVSSNKYTLFRAEQLSRAAEEGYATSPARQVLPAYGQDVMMSPRCSSRSRECRPSSRRPPPACAPRCRSSPSCRASPDGRLPARWQRAAGSPAGTAVRVCPQLRGHPDRAPGCPGAALSSGDRPQTLLEVRRVAGCAFAVEQLGNDEFETLLMAHYQRDSSEARQLMEDLGNEMDFFALAEELPQSEDLLDADDDAPSFASSMPC
jgi:general secretion pathway protein D